MPEVITSASTMFTSAGLSMSIHKTSPDPRTAEVDAAQPPPARWEWRTFEYSPERWQDVLGGGQQMTAGSLTTETYLLVPGSGANVKVRNGLLEIKELLRTSEAGLQQWWPTLRASFPLTPADLTVVLATWSCPAAPAAPIIGSPEALIGFLQQRMPVLRALPVKKWRRSFDLEGCKAERATILVRGELLESMAVEHLDPTLLLHVLQSHHLDRLPNTSYPVALGRVLGWGGSMVTAQERGYPPP